MTMRFAPPEVAAAIQAVRQRQIESIAATPPRSRRRVALQDRLVLTTAQLLACEPPVKLTPREVIAQEIAMRRSKR